MHHHRPRLPALVRPVPLSARYDPLFLGAYAKTVYIFALLALLPINLSIINRQYFKSRADSDSVCVARAMVQLLLFAPIQC